MQTHSCSGGPWPPFVSFTVNPLSSHWPGWGKGEADQWVRSVLSEPSLRVTFHLHARLQPVAQQYMWPGPGP